LVGEFNDNYRIDDSDIGYQRDLGFAPPIVKQDLEHKKVRLRRDPFSLRIVRLRGRYNRLSKINLAENYRYVFYIDLNSHRIYSYELKHRSQAYQR
jgi:mRNA-degrading endonuclease RelE of RelBE toxin-antitoxin system